MKTFKELLETINPPESPGEAHFVAKHIIKKFKHPVAKDDQFNGEIGKKKAKRKADYDKGEDAEVYEEVKMTPAEYAAKQKILRLKKQLGDAHSALKKESIDESTVAHKTKEKYRKHGEKSSIGDADNGKNLSEASFAPGSKLKLQDGSQALIGKDESGALTYLFKSLTPENQKKMSAKMLKNMNAFNEIVTFAKGVM